MSTMLAPIAAESPDRRTPTLEECIKPFLGWFVAIRGRRPNTILAYQRDLKAFVAFAERAGVRTPSRVTFQLIELYQAHRLHREGKKVSTVNRSRYAIERLFLFLRRQGLVTTNPVHDTFALKEPERLPHYLTVAEQERLLAHFATLESLAGRRDYALISVALFCGLRCEELATARLDALDLEAGKLTVVGKGNKQRECDVTPRLAVILTDYLRDVRPKLMAFPIRGYLRRERGRGPWYASYQLDGKETRRSTGTTDEAVARAVLADLVRGLAKAQESPYLFPKASTNGQYFDAKAGQAILTRTIYQVIRRKVSPIVGRPVHPHMLRHSFASRLREAGAPLELIQEALGHADIATTLIYAHISTKKRREDIAKYLGGG